MRPWQTVALLWFAYFLHQADKQIYSVVLTPVRADLGLSAYEAGLVNTIFTIVVAIMSPLAGALGDRWPRHRVLYMIVAVWSAGTIMTAAAPSLAILLLTRSLVVSGAESFYPPVSHAVLAACHSQRSRAFAISIHQTAQYSGPVGSGFLAGWIAEHFGWRQSFLLFGVAGLLLAPLMAWRLTPQPVHTETAAKPLFGGFAFCFRNAVVRWMGLAFASVLFVTIGYATWAPTIFARQFGLSLSQAGLQATLWSSASAMAGALAGGAISDWWASSKQGRSRMLPQGVALLCGAPFLWMLGAAQTLPQAITALAGVGFFRGIYEGTIAVALYDHVRPEHRASAAAVVLLVANLLAAPSSAVLGWIADSASDLNRAVSMLSLSFGAGALVLLYASRMVVTPASDRDTLDVPS